MPYNPGNSNMGGQYMANGILDAAKSLSGAWMERSKQEDQDKLFNAQSKATEGLLKSYLPKDKADEVLRLDPKETPEARHARLTGTIENFVVDNKLKQFQQTQQQQVTDNAALNKALSQFLPQGTGQQLAGGADFAGLRDPNSQQSFDPTRFMATYFQSGGSPASLDKVDQALKMFMPPRSTAKAVDPASYEDTDPNTGQPIQVTVDQLTGRRLGSGPKQQPKYVLTPEEQVTVAGQTEGAKKDAELASVFVNSVPDAAEVAQGTLSNISEIEKLYAAGTKSGFGQDFLNGASALGLRLGLVKPGVVADQQELGKLLAGNALQFAREVMKGTGAVSDFERRKVDQASADLGKSPEANLRIMQLSKAVAERAQDMELKRQELVDGGKNTMQIAEQLRRWRSSNTLENYVSKTKAASDVKLPIGWSIK